MSTPETSAIVWGSRRVSYTIHRSARRKKTVAVTVEPTGSVLVIAPERLATDRLDAIVTHKAEWIVRRLRRAGDHTPPASPREFVSGESVLYLGRHYRLKVDPRATGDAKLRGGWLHVPALGGSAKDRSRASRFGVLVPPSRRRTTSGTSGGMAVEGGYSSAPRHRRGPTETLGKLQPAWHHSAELAHHPGADAAHRLRRRPRAGASAPSRPQSQLLAGRRTGYAGLRAAPRGTAAVRNRVGVVGITAASCSSVVIGKRNVCAERA